MTADQMRDKYESGDLTWADLLEITGLHASELFDVLHADRAALSALESTNQ